MQRRAGDQHDWRIGSSITTRGVNNAHAPQIRAISDGASDCCVTAPQAELTDSSTNLPINEAVLYSRANKALRSGESELTISKAAWLDTRQSSKVRSPRNDARGLNLHGSETLEVGDKKGNALPAFARTNGDL